jgi:hypothetical protein
MDLKIIWSFVSLSKIYSQFENNLYRSLKDGQVFKMNQKLKIWFVCQEFISNNMYNRKALAMKQNSR